MKNYLKISILFLGIFLFQNCSEHNLKEDQIETVELDPVIQELLDLGYNLEDIEELEEFYLVQGDLLFSKDINEYKMNQSGHYAKHASTNNLVSQTNVTSMTVYIDGSVSLPGDDNWTSAIANAMNDYNSINGSKVNFIFTISSSTADIIIKSDNGILGNGVMAAANFPTNGKPYNTILINIDYSSNRVISASEKRFTIVHELGHCIGLRHTNWETNDIPTNIGANLIPGTPPQDPNSVMNGNVLDFNWYGFSQYDLVAIRYLYPSVISGTYLICGGNQTYTLIGATATSWQVSSNLQILSSSGTSATVQRINSTNGSGYIDAITPSGTIRYNVWIGAFNQSVTTGTNAVCISQAYHYTCVVPGGHKPGYTYRWTLPTSDWYIYGPSNGPTIYAGPSGSNANVTGQMRVEVNTGCGGWTLVGGLVTYPSYSCP